MSSVYQQEVWDDYAEVFLSVMPSMMVEMNRTVASYAQGDVIDFGCGVAKVAPFILESPQVRSYTGIDYSPEMTNRARWFLKQFPDKPRRIMQGKIEDVIIDIKDTYDFGVSINSYYAWNNPAKILRYIYQALKNQAGFILVTPNRQINMHLLLKEARLELGGNRHFEKFCQMNLALVGNKKAKFVGMNELVNQLHGAGFKLVEAHQHFYQGGLNYLLVRKG